MKLYQASVIYPPQNKTKAPLISNFFSMLNILLTQIDHRYLFKRSVVVKKNGSKVVLAPSVKIKRSSIRFRKGSDTTIGEGVKISDSVIILENGAKLIVGKGVSLDKVRITVKNGTLVNRSSLDSGRRILDRASTNISNR